ncbi:MAG: NAD-glutamate dehydrogenase [Solirubrobacteraceae bacterium]
MSVKASELEEELIDAVCARVRERLPEPLISACEAFVRQYYRWVPAEDLANRSPEDLFGAALAHWRLLARRAPEEMKVRVYNPELEQHGWQSPHTVVEIVTDDMPFLVDSVTMELARAGYALDLVIHPVIRLRRDGDGNVIDVVAPEQEAPDARSESILHAEITREPDRDPLERLRSDLERVVGEVDAAVSDWAAMRRRALELVDELGSRPPPIAGDELEQAQQFLRWLTDDHFTFLGFREYDLVVEDGEASLKVVTDSGLGILRGPPKASYKKLGPKATALAQTRAPLVLTKANARATVHRPAHLDYVGVKRFGPDGRVTGERRFLGLYSTAAYRESSRNIPLLANKVDQVLERAGFPIASHDAKALIEILESYPRDSLLQIEVEDLFTMAMGILALGERQRVRLFVRADALDRFVDCLVCIPRDRFNTENRERVGRILIEAFGGSHVDWALRLSESVLARVQYIVHCPDGVQAVPDVSEIESRLVQATRAWSDDLSDALVEEHGEDRGGKILARYARAFPPAYRDERVARSAVADIARIEELADAAEPIINLYRPLAAPKGVFRCKLFSRDGISLSDVLPRFEHMGAKVVDERPYEITPAGRDPVWIYDFGLRCVTDDLERVRDLFQEAFLAVWRGDLEDDGLNALVLRAQLCGEEVMIIRAIAKYLRQGGLAFSDAYIELTLLGHPRITVLLVKLFALRLDPDARDADGADQLQTEIETAIDAVESLDEDRILRSYMNVITAILRTNYFRVADGDAPRSSLAFKLDPELVAVLPLPRPRFEIFVYSPQMEGVHLRGGKVARGGLRWSDRREDFRTEVLGLLKAQMVKNALIVPVGSKGGFVVKQPRQGREALQEQAIDCYRTFLAGLLDLTDNIVDGAVIGPERTVRYDEDDPYLVVAADKGTASFSDIANEVAAGYGFWLGDAFASGGSHGYDHKAMGITARGAWESVKRHFRELGTDIGRTDFSVIGIGDMSGDVFGNGMLLSRHIKLIGAFNHMHVFLDPEPDPQASFDERKRLFERGRSGWGDYDTSLISPGGGVYPRSVKAIKLSPQVREALSIDAEELSPNELIRELLRAPVDLLWNGGIGTYVKAAHETHAEVGDKTNDAVRVDGAQLRVRVVGEGGNLGLTQRGRIEYTLAGGRLNTDAIDNVAGVNCSDHEVNIKILLDSLVIAGELTGAQRNDLLSEMTDSVAERVLYGSYIQTQAMSLALRQAAGMVDVHVRLIRHLEQVAGLHRELEFLPDEQGLEERKSNQAGLTAPELAVVMAYCKIDLYSQLLDSDLPEDSHLAHDLLRYFPPPLPERFSQQMRGHRLRREIIATVVANQLVDRAGTTFAFRLAEETGAPAPILARGFAVAREVLDMRSFWSAVEELDNRVPAATQLDMLIEGRRLMERSTRRLVRADPHALDITVSTRYFQPGARMLARAIPDVLGGDERRRFDEHASELEAAGVPGELARRVAAMPAMLSAFDIVEVARAIDADPQIVMRTHFQLGSRLELNRLRDRIVELPRENRWEVLARAALRDDLYSLHRALTQEVLSANRSAIESETAIETWMKANAAALERYLRMLADIKSAGLYGTTTLPVALREIRNLMRGGGASQGTPGAESVTMAG